MRERPISAEHPSQARLAQQALHDAAQPLVLLDQHAQEAAPLGLAQVGAVEQDLGQRRIEVRGVLRSCSTAS